jgi:hypothetical protein
LGAIEVWELGKCFGDVFVAKFYSFTGGDWWCGRDLLGWGGD